MIGIDVGFGWTKVVSEEKTFKFPTWLAYYTPDPIAEVDTVKYGDKVYVIGSDVKYEAQRVEITGITELMNYFPVFLKYVEAIIGKQDRIVTGIPIKYRSYLDKFKNIIEEANHVECDILPQGIGIFLDVEERLSDENLILDIGFNTLDYLILIKKDGEWKKRKGNTIEKLGLIRAVDVLRSSLPDELGYARNFSFSRLLEIFEKGSIRLEGEKIDISNIKRKALEEYTEMIKTRLKDEIGGISDIETVVVAGGGANLIKIDIFEADMVIIPDEPEFSQARGYFKLGR